jgi:hypothetical protein
MPRTTQRLASGRYDQLYLSNYAAINVRDAIRSYRR